MGGFDGLDIFGWNEADEQSLSSRPTQVGYVIQQRLTNECNVPVHKWFCSIPCNVPKSKLPQEVERRRKRCLVRSGCDFFLRLHFCLLVGLREDNNHVTVLWVIRRQPSQPIERNPIACSIESTPTLHAYQPPEAVAFVRTSTNVKAIDASGIMPYQTIKRTNGQPRALHPPRWSTGD